MGMMALPLRVPNLDAPAALRVGARGVPGDSDGLPAALFRRRRRPGLVSTSGGAACERPSGLAGAAARSPCHWQRRLPVLVSGRRPGIAAVTVRVGGR